jgi:hypothetical protein
MSSCHHPGFMDDDAMQGAVVVLALDDDAMNLVFDPAPPDEGSPGKDDKGSEEADRLPAGCRELTLQCSPHQTPPLLAK